MPNRALRPCSHPGCRELTAGRRFCIHHMKAEWRRQDAARPRRQDRGVIGPDWQALRLKVLRRDPLCVRCRRIPSSVVDHIVPRSQGGSDSTANLRGLCLSCHSSETAKFDGGFGNRVRPGKVAR